MENEKQTTTAEHGENSTSISRTLDQKQGGIKSTRRLTQKGKRVSKNFEGRKYSLRSSKDSVGKSPTEPENASVQQVTMNTRRRKIRKAKKTSHNEFLTIQKRVRYLLTRIKCEQNLIDAYACEGWRGQSLEKIRPEKELERAKAEILQRKLRIRDTFQHIDSLLSEGKAEVSRFDSQGEISSEDISCARCSSKDSSVDNDIILCDGTCDRGFHQKCLNPPLLTENIPPGDERWLCPACVCKVDCMVLLNEFQGSDLSTKDSWEKVFPEAAATDPNVPEGHNEYRGEESSSEESDFTAASENLASLNQKKQYDDSAYPSDNSEDDDYDPDGLDPDKDSNKGQSSSNGSDFTSDSDDFCAELVKASGTVEFSSGPGEVSTPSLLDTTPIEPDLSQDRILPVLGRRQRERLDYKKLYDDTYGKESDSSEDEDWSEKGTRKKGKKGNRGTESDGSPQLNELDSNGNNNTARNKHFGRLITQKLHEIFKTEQYPSRAMKEILAQELGLTARQVGRWFESTRHMMRSSKSGPGKNDRSSADTVRKIESNDETAVEATVPTEAVEYEGGSKDCVNDSQHSRELTDSARKKAILRELRRRRMIR